MKYYLSVCCLFFLGACANMPPQIKNYPAVALSYSQAAQDPSAYQDTPVRWGGTIIDVENETDSSLAQILFYPIDRNGHPQINLESEGRFAVKTSKFLDPAIFIRGEEVTVAGTLAGKIERVVGNKTLLIPLISAKAIYLWPADYRRNRHFYGARGNFLHPAACPCFGFGHPFMFRGWPHWHWMWW